jgi:2-C-methyl-D-erythritol 4-phosphate cytidylyltransferase
MKKRKSDLFISAVIVAAGRGTRMNMDINKQYIEVCGVPVLARTLKTFEDCDCIDEIIIVVNAQDIVFCKQEIVDDFGFTKVKSLVAGGNERQQSVYNGLKEVDPRCDVVLIHDGARPFIREESIIGSIDAALECGASGVGVPVKDTVKVGDEEGYIRETLDRKAIWTIQTPQTFRYGVIMEAHQKAEIDAFSGTDDTMLAERMGVRIKLVMGSYDNIKITTQEDLAFAEAIVRSRER